MSRGQLRRLDKVMKEIKELHKMPGFREEVRRIIKATTGVHKLK